MPDTIRINYNSMTVINALKYCERNNITSSFGFLKRLTRLNNDDLKNGIHINLALDFIEVENKKNNIYKLK